MKKYYLSNEEILQNYGAMFENLGKDTLLKTELSEYGYDDVKINEGKALYNKARQTYDANKKETTEAGAASLAFQEKYQENIKIFQTHRKKARIIFEDNAEAMHNLKLKGAFSKTLAKSIEEMREFYQTLDTTQMLLTPLKQLKITPEMVKNQLKNITEIEKKYADFLQEKGESQQATKAKDAAFDTLDKWVSKFFKIAKIALEDKPQLLESLGKFMRS